MLGCHMSQGAPANGEVGLGGHVSKAVTSIKARWLKHRNTFGLGCTLSFDQTLKFPRRFESCLTLMV